MFYYCPNSNFYGFYFFSISLLYYSSICFLLLRPRRRTVGFYEDCYYDAFCCFDYLTSWWGNVLLRTMDSINKLVPNSGYSDSFYWWSSESIFDYVLGWSLPICFFDFLRELRRFSKIYTLPPFCFNFSSAFIIER